jgi:hypothetical protein
MGKIMISQETIRAIQHAPVPERIQVLELLLNTFKQDIIHITKSGQRRDRRFVARPFNLGQEVHVDRDAIYAERIIK